VQELLEKNWTVTLTEEESIRLAVRALLEVVDSGAKNIELAVMSSPQEEVKILEEGTLQAIIEDIEKEQEEAKKNNNANSVNNTSSA
jgi:20S proteasome subunit alpha 4